jgi:hypothetical protein
MSTGTTIFFVNKQIIEMSKEKYIERTAQIKSELTKAFEQVIGYKQQPNLSNSPLMNGNKNSKKLKRKL